MKTLMITLIPAIGNTNFPNQFTFFKNRKNFKREFIIFSPKRT